MGDFWILSVRICDQTQSKYQIWWCFLHTFSRIFCRVAMWNVALKTFVSHVPSAGKGIFRWIFLFVKDKENKNAILIAFLLLALIYPFFIKILPFRRIFSNGWWIWQTTPSKVNFGLDTNCYLWKWLKNVLNKVEVSSPNWFV